KPLYYGQLPGSESGVFNWGFLEAPGNAPGEPGFDGLFKWVFGPKWDWRTFDVEPDMAKVDAVLGPALNGAVTGDLAKFRDRGGKLIVFQGWADPIVPVGQTVNFYKDLMSKFGGEGKTKEFARLFMVPGMGHCGFGTGPNRFDSSAFGGAQPPALDPEHDIFTALSHWVEGGVAPAQVIATKFVDGDASKGIEMQRPLCPYPQRAWYKGDGDTNSAANFVCAVDKK
ncbi:MAG: tannase/feruloyl esterase family alpha/beta hydrolase, partial [Roseiarcus sp.]